tara:strand:- start:5444 stop:6442 length:999 start_codon:yes stop_codon:yes gene_type:complete
MEKVLVTGATGFIGLHCVKKLLDQGYIVNGTLRSLDRSEEIISSLQNNNTSTENLHLYEVDLMSDEGWDEAVEGCDYMLHVASPFVLSRESLDFFVKPAVEGATRALKFADLHNLKKVVLTSSFAAVGDTFDGTKSFDESNWSDTSNDRMTNYSISKTLAEKAAWKFMEENKVNFKLTVINPTAVLGPSISKDIGTSNDLVLRMLNGSMPTLAKIHIGIVDVRDVADAHILAMKNDDSDGERIITSENELWMTEVSDILVKHGYNPPTKVIPSWVLKLVGIINSDMNTISKMTGKVRDCHSTKAKDLLGWKPITAEESIIATAKQLEEYKLI